jgi:16S rRNA (cytidine1402-2'-O)-methyltransferase
MNKGTLFIVATPIGNLKDITFRAIETLKEVDLIACEDTRTTRVLLDHYGIKTPTISYHQHSQITKIELIIGKLAAGNSIAVVTDAGTPGISDPANYLVQRIREHNNCLHKPLHCHSERSEESCSNEKILRSTQDDIKVVPIPGASALTASVSVSGLVDKDFYFAGFLPRKKGRQTELKKLSSLDVPVVIYEAANRVEKTLTELKEYFGQETKVFLAREITKKFEEYKLNTINMAIAGLKDMVLKGEFVLIVCPKN